jgi:hypothetical protein
MDIHGAAQQAARRKAEASFRTPSDRRLHGVSSALELAALLAGIAALYLTVRRLLR